MTLFARNPVAAQSVAARFEVPVKPLDAFSGSRFDGLVNTTPVGMKSGVQGSGFRVQGSTNELPNSQSSVLSPQSSVLFPNGEMPISGESLRGLQWVYDLIYTPRPTPLLHTAHTYTIATLDGLDMLLSQAALQFEFWTRCSPPLEVMRNAAEQVLSSEFRL
ncbi:MAG: hypothetical protein K1Y36_23295 [Blastocatellia bacterium]|nr:hypothetical protein [Blastocatellia bacterium]